LKWILEKQDGVVWSGFIVLRIGTGSGPLWNGKRTFGFHKIMGNSWEAGRLLASQEELGSMGLVT
jgi:hypothetical protein